MLSESKIQSKFIKYAKANGFIYIKTIKLSESGHADLMFFKNGKTIFVEVKNASGGVKSPLQEYRQKQFQKAGFTWEFCSNLEELKQCLK